MECPYCYEINSSQVLATRLAEKNVAIRRRRKCLECGERFSTLEHLEDPPSRMLKPNLRFKLNTETQQYSYEPKLTGQELQGQRYKQVLKECSGQLVKYFVAAKTNKDKITRVEIIEVSQKIGLPLKATCEFLEYNKQLPTGTWERKFSQVSVKELMELYFQLSKDNLVD